MELVSTTSLLFLVHTPFDRTLEDKPKPTTGSFSRSPIEIEWLILKVILGWGFKRISIYIYSGNYNTLTGTQKFFRHVHFIDIGLYRIF